jgi:hypothetical protein
VAISIRTSKFRMGLFNDDRLAGQFKLRMDPSWDLEPPLARQLKFRIELIGQNRSSDGGCKLARSLSQLQARPSILQATASVRSGPARSLASPAR